MACLMGLLLTCPQPTVIGTATVDLNYTTYEGLQWSNGVNAFLGMRYAAPPVGHLRWRAPVEPARTEGGTVESAKTVSELDLAVCTDPRLMCVVRPDMPRHWHGISCRWPERRLPLCQRLGANQRYQDIEAARVGVYSGRR